MNEQTDTLHDQKEHFQNNQETIEQSKIMDFLEMKVTARTWIYSCPQSSYGFKTNAKRPLSDLTKIMTMLCAVQACKKFKISIAKTYFKVTEWAANTQGTKSNLINGSWISIEDLLYALMLAGGNDAGIVLAENIGAVIYFDIMGNHSFIEQIKSMDLSEDKENAKVYQSAFIDYMNNKAHQLKMTRTRFSNPHGLNSQNHYTCCSDAVLMFEEAIKIDAIREILRHQTYKGRLKFLESGKIMIKPVYWTNTNRLLGKSNIHGALSAMNPKGASVWALFKQKSSQYAMVIVAGSISIEEGLKDVEKIIDWIQKSIVNADEKAIQKQEYSKFKW